MRLPSFRALHVTGLQKEEALRVSLQTIRLNKGEFETVVIALDGLLLAGIGLRLRGGRGITGWDGEKGL